MGLNLRNANAYKTSKAKSFSEKLTALSTELLSDSYRKKQVEYYSDSSNFSASFMGTPNPFLVELKKFSVQEIVVKSIVDSLSKQTLDLLIEEFTNRVCKVEADAIKVARPDNDQRKLSIMLAEKVDVLRAGKSSLMTHEVFKFNNGQGFDDEITVAEYVYELCYELVLSDMDEKAQQEKFMQEVRTLFVEFAKAYGTSIKQKYRFKSESSLKGIMSSIEVRNEANPQSPSKIVNQVYKDSFLFDDDY
ncbi:hypothetical protein [Pseudomonas putida]|uniref:hypothetical protein n=1 Tax=Pseudomonas putida TaxID=303 RepID=UPI0013AF1780|nr:hypothetical protein [Pseudomonas putida]